VTGFMNFDGKRAVVTGGASGIGRALVEQLVASGARVVVADIDHERAAAVAEEAGNGAVPLACDVSDHGAVEALSSQAELALGGVDLVFANAGVSLSGPLLGATAREFDWIFGVNVRGVWSTASVFAGRMAQLGQPGHICMTASEHAIGLQHPGAGLYTAGKHAVLGLADVLRAELPGHIGVSCFCPGLVATDIHLSRRHGPLPQASPESLAFAAALMAQGMAPEAVARSALEGVARGDFLIVTHPSSLAAATRRHEELVAAFAEQAPWSADADRYDVNKVAAALMSGGAHSSPQAER
jgi:NAD(P)-dependent dehydrogenase (short-subunit alcohol dehydrogenase family)